MALDHLKRYAGINKNGNFQTWYGQPIPVWWDGFKSDTMELGRNGWEIEAHEDIRTMEMILAVRHRRYKVVCWNRFPYRYDRGLYDLEYVPTLNVQLHIGSEVYVPEDRLRYTYPVDPFPSPRDLPFAPQGTCKPASEYMHFRPKEAIQVLADPSVDDLLAQIIEKQKATTDEYFREKVESGKLVKASSAEIIQFSKAA